MEIHLKAICVVGVAIGSAGLLPKLISPLLLTTLSRLSSLVSHCQLLWGTTSVQVAAVTAANEPIKSHQIMLHVRHDFHFHVMKRGCRVTGKAETSHNTHR